MKTKRVRQSERNFQLYGIQAFQHYTHYVLVDAAYDKQSKTEGKILCCARNE